MAQMNGIELADISQVKNLLCSVSTNVAAFFKEVRTGLSDILPPINHDISEIQGEVWRDLSAVYYKYEDGSQKKAFRQVVNDMSTKIEAGNWDSIYKRLYRIEHKN